MHESLMLIDVSGPAGNISGPAGNISPYRYLIVVLTLCLRPKEYEGEGRVARTSPRGGVPCFGVIAADTPNYPWRMRRIPLKSRHG